MRIQCPNCKKIDFYTTDKFDSEKRPNGSMVRCTLPYMIDWLLTAGTSVSEMTCPRCAYPLAVKGRLVLIEDDNAIELTSLHQSLDVNIDSEVIGEVYGN